MKKENFKKHAKRLLFGLGFVGGAAAFIVVIAIWPMIGFIVLGALIVVLCYVLGMVLLDE